MFFEHNECMEYSNIDFPSTWKKHKPSLCRGCLAGCCTMPVEVKIEDLVRLGLVGNSEALGSQKKIANQLLKSKVIVNFRQNTGLFMLAQKPNQDCIFLDSKTRLCTVYERRPGVCRQFPEIGPRPGFCPAKSNESM